MWLGIYVILDVYVGLNKFKFVCVFYLFYLLILIKLKIKKLLIELVKDDFEF